VISLGYEHHLYVEDNVISVTGRVSSEVRTSSTGKKVKLSPYQAVESYRCDFTEVRTPSTCKKKIYPRSRAWKTIGMFLVRYELHLHVNG
jgi:hypothetical protein